MKLQCPAEAKKVGDRVPAHTVYEEYDYQYEWKLKVSGAAWQDEDSEKSPGKRIRHWASIDVGTYPFQDIQKEKIGLQRVLTEAFAKVSALSFSDLSEQEVIPPRG